MCPAIQVNWPHTQTGEVIWGKPPASIQQPEAGASGYCSVNFFKIRVALVPPKPKELVMATLTVA